MKVVICTVAYLGWYRRGVARMIQKFEEVSPGYEIQAWVNTLPPGTPEIVKDGVSYTGYAAKPWALSHAMQTADVALLLDASVYPIRHIEPLLDFINGHGYYLAPAGFTIGEWTNDEMLAKFGMDRDHALKIPDVASGIVGALAAAGLALFVIAISGGDVPIGIPGHDHATSVTGGGAGLDLSVLCTSGTSELLITGPDGSEQRVRCP